MPRDVARAVRDQVWDTAQRYVFFHYKSLSSDSCKNLRNSVKAMLCSHHRDLQVVYDRNACTWLMALPLKTLLNSRKSCVSVCIWRLGVAKSNWPQALKPDARSSINVGRGEVYMMECRCGLCLAVCDGRASNYRQTVLTRTVERAVFKTLRLQLTRHIHISSQPFGTQVCRCPPRVNDEPPPLSTRARSKLQKTKVGCETLQRVCRWAGAASLCVKFQPTPAAAQVGLLHIS